MTEPQPTTTVAATDPVTEKVSVCVFLAWIIGSVAGAVDLIRAGTLTTGLSIITVLLMASAVVDLLDDIRRRLG